MRRRGARATNKGFARRSQEFLAWEEGDWEEEWVRYVGGGRGWEWWRGGAVSTNNGFARRPQKILASEMGVRM